MTTGPSPENRPYDSLLLVSFGGPESPGQVMPFLRQVTGGRGIPDERLAEVAQHYDRFGGVSPIQEQNRRLLSALRETLDLPVYWGNRNTGPWLVDALREMAADGRRRSLAFVTSAFSSYSGCRQYREDIARAQLEVPGVPRVEKLRQFFDHPGFLDPFVEGVLAAAAGLPDARLIFTAHSIPVSMAATAAYEAQLHAAAAVVAAASGFTSWEFAWQSRSGPPSVPWLEPDINDALRSVYAEGVRAVIVVPLGFVSDHMEVAFDLDTEAVETVASLPGLRMARVGTPGTQPDERYVGMVADLVRERVSQVVMGDRQALAPAQPRWDVCAPGCCRAPIRPRTRPTFAS